MLSFLLANALFLFCIITARCALVNTFEHSYQKIFCFSQLNIIDYYSFESFISQSLDYSLGSLVGFRVFSISIFETSKSSAET